jgi:hypothetical protein
MSFQWGKAGVEIGRGAENEGRRPFLEQRIHPRFPLDVAIRIYPRNSPVVRGHTVDISESGIAAMVSIEIPTGEVVRLEFTVPLGEVEVFALVRQRNAFRYGFQFLEASAAQDVIARTCRELAMRQDLNRPTI